jgi:hypothetical protein
LILLRQIYQQSSIAGHHCIRNQTLKFFRYIFFGGFPDGMILGEVTDGSVKIQIPDAIQQARWMGTDSLKSASLVSEKMIGFAFLKNELTRLRRVL